MKNPNREFNKKYDREAKEEKLFELLMSETEKQKKYINIFDYVFEKNIVFINYFIYTYRNEEMKINKLKLTKDMFEAGDMYKKFKYKQKNNHNQKIKHKLNAKYAVIQNDEESKIKRESTPLIDEQNNAVIIWSISDNVFPKVCLLYFNMPLSVIIILILYHILNIYREGY